MSGCNATLTVTRTTLPCRDHDDLAAFPHGGVFIRWSDDAPGAKPHTPPSSRVTDFTDPSTVDVDTVIGNIDRRYAVRGDQWTDLAIWPNVTVKALADEIGRLRATWRREFRTRQAARLNGEDDGDASAVRGPLRDALWGTP